MSSVLHTELCDLLGCDLPVIQTAMGWIATPELVIASSNAGAFGFLSAAVSPVEEVRANIAKTRAGTNRKFGVNFHMFQPGAAEIVDLIIENKDQVRAVSYGRGPDAKTIQRFKDAGILCIPTVGAVKHAVKAVELGADVIVIQGGEGGGHTGSVPTSLLLPQVLDAVDVPVVAAGGFHDGRGLAAALAYGAVGIAMGTRFLLTQESPVPAATKERYLNADVTQIPVSKALDGLPQRMIMNKVLKDLDSASTLGLLFRAAINAFKFRNLTGASFFGLLKSGIEMARKTDMTLGQTIMAPNAPVLIQKSMVHGRPDEGVLPSGQVAGLIRELPTCQALLSKIAQDAEERIEVLTRQDAPTSETSRVMGGVNAH